MGVRHGRAANHSKGLHHGKNDVAVTLAFCYLAPMARILIADDEQNLRKVLWGQLRRDGHEAEAVGHARAALKALTTASFDILITDLKMPGMDGLSLLERIHEMLPDLPVIIMTAHSDLENPILERPLLHVKTIRPF